VGNQGNEDISERYLEEIEEWFYMYYDTELFKTPILDCIEQSDKNYERLSTAIKDILGFGLWDATFGRGLTFYNFRHVDEDVFGKAYEMFMAEHRKEQGIYYTPKEITTYMAEKLIEDTFGPLKDELLLILSANPIDYEKAKKCAEKLASLTILDPACGSGSFLIKALRSIFNIYQFAAEDSHF
jgi:type I restriction-modification system DNA methylase subunit